MMSSCSPSVLLTGSRSLSAIESEPHSRIRKSLPFPTCEPAPPGARSGCGGLVTFQVAPGRRGTGCESEFRETTNRDREPPTLLVKEKSKDTAPTEVGVYLGARFARI